MTEILRLTWLTTPELVTPGLRHQLRKCWRDVANSGGAVGFPFPPVSDNQASSAVETLVESIGHGVNRVLVATVNDQLAGWLFMAGNSNPLTTHWAQVLRVQTALEFRRSGVGRALMKEVARAAVEDLALEQLHLELRSGLGLEGFYQACGWREIGRWPAALRLPSGDRDEVLMALDVRAVL